jgi:hypothetical protein
MAQNVPIPVLWIRAMNRVPMSVLVVDNHYLLLKPSIIVALVGPAFSNP